MRVTSATIQGYGRLAKTKINLDSKVIAIVGPNEAGKTTLLKALANLDVADELATPLRSRAVEVTDDTVVTSVDIVLDDDDRRVVSDLSLDVAPHAMTVGRRAAGGAVLIDVRPHPIKARSTLYKALEVFRRHEDDPDIPDYVDPETTYADPGGDAPRHYPSELKGLAEGVSLILETVTDDFEDDGLEVLAQRLLSVTLDEDEGEDLRSALSAVIEFLQTEPPQNEVKSRLWKRTPDFVLFDEPDRSLQSTYTLNDALAENVPPALSNLALMAGLDIPALLAYQQSGDFGRRLTHITQANARLGAIFADAWKQSLLSVRFDVDGNELRIMIWEDGDNITVFSERSAGLRMFIALIAFLRVNESPRQPILLIDEAENHLHLDAQADLVNMFMTQQQATKVIYTTHSPACLPPDLGTGVRSVVPRTDNQQISDVRNSFWQGAGGYSPLMLAMGAAAAAFTPARCVVLAEGASEMILLPSLIRNATALSTLEYQVAPGLSEVPKDFYPKLDFEGAKVAYLVDGDDGGTSLVNALIGAGVPAQVIVTLDAPGIENTLDPEAYLSAVRSLLIECNPGQDIPSLPELTAVDSSWAKYLTDWAKAAGLRIPSKVAVASWLVENNKAIPSTEGGLRLSSVHNALDLCFTA